MLLSFVQKYFYSIFNVTGTFCFCTVANHSNNHLSLIWSLGWNYIGAKAKILFDLCRYSSPPNANTQLRNVCIHSKRYRFRFRVRSNIIPPLKGIPMSLRKSHGLFLIMDVRKKGLFDRDVWGDGNVPVLGWRSHWIFPGRNGVFRVLSMQHWVHWKLKHFRNLFWILLSKSIQFLTTFPFLPFFSCVPF